MPGLPEKPRPLPQCSNCCLLQTVAALPSQHGHMLRGVAAACLLQPPDKALARAEFKLAATGGKSADAAAIAQDARAWLGGQVQCL